MNTHAQKGIRKSSKIRYSKQRTMDWIAGKMK